mmetsp:Transcript_9466/g.14001  ORF Transcript_9466/g.14001 Transcript_9466/m.14001 type:complete len:288 (+) Transcript_9466:51-914(+)
MSELGKKEIIAIAKHFLISSPPGEFEQVKKDVEEIVDNEEILNSDEFKNVFYEYNVEQFTPVNTDAEDEKSRMFIICSYNQVGDDKTKFRDPVSKQIFEIDHVTSKVIGSSPDETTFTEKQQTRRETIQKSIDEYVKNAFIDTMGRGSNEPHGVSSVFADVKDENKYVIVISASKHNEKNQWSGRWRSVYQVTFSDADKIDIVGKMKVNIHNFETGNTLMNTSREAKGELKDIKEDLKSKLNTWELGFQNYIYDQCASFDDIFKVGIRRDRPVQGLFNFTNLGGMIQ